MRIDTHAHVMPADVMGAAGKYGPTIVISEDGFGIMKVGPYESRVGGGKGMAAATFEKLGDPGRRIQEMDERQIDKMVVTISPLFYLYWAEEEIRVPFASTQNDALSKYCAEDPSRLFFLATLPLPSIEAAVAEIRRAVTIGARGINVGTGDFDGVDLDSPTLWPVYEELVRSGLPLFLHPYPLPMASGTEDRYNLSWVVGYNYQESLAYAHLVLGGVFDDFPGLKVIITHGGGSVPYQFGRLEEARRRQPDVRAKQPLDAYRNNVFFDILLHDLRARQFLVDFVGADQLLVGDNYGGWDAADGFAMLEELDLSQIDREKISGANAARLFNLT